MKMDQTAENQSKAFFASKNIDVSDMEYTMKTTMASLSQQYMKK